jgi:hypothetical protein
MKLWPTCAALALVTATLGCGPSYLMVPARPTQPLTASARGVAAEVTNLWITADSRLDGFGEDSRLVVGLRVRNDGTTPRRVSPGSFSCVMSLDPTRPGDARALLAAGGGEGTFAGEMPDAGSLLSAVTIPPGQSREVWAMFQGYRFEQSGVPHTVTVRVPVEGLPPLVVTIADPQRGALRWETPAVTRGWHLSIKNVGLYADGMGGAAPSWEIGAVVRSGPILWDLGILSTVFAMTQGRRLTSETSVFTGSGLTAHVTYPFLSWGTPESPRQLGVYTGVAASALVEALRPPIAMDAKPHVYGLFQAEGGVELDLGTLRLARTPFPLAVTGRGLPRWALRLGYIQSWAGGATSGGSVLSVRFTW